MEPFANEYDQYCSVQCMEAKDSLVKFTLETKIPECGLTVFDMGCGSGKVTRKILLEALTKYELNKIIAVDKNPSMIEYAKKNYGHPKIEFKEFDMNSNKQSDIWKEKIDVLFGFHSLHWMEESIALRNINNLLKSGGEILLKQVINYPYGTAQLKVIKEEKWNKFFEKGMPKIPAIENRNIDDFITTFLENGFIMRHLEMDCVVYKLDDEYETKENVKQANSCKSFIPDYLWEDFLDSVFEEYKAQIMKMKEFNVKDPRNSACMTTLLIHAIKK